MTLCASCGLRLSSDQALCPHHHVFFDHGEWAKGNRLMNDFFREKMVPPTPDEEKGAWFGYYHLQNSADRYSPVVYGLRFVGDGLKEVPDYKPPQ